MNISKIYQHCNYIVAAANQIETKGENNAAQIIGICRTARMIQQELQRKESVQDEQTSIGTPCSGDCDGE